MALPNTSHDLCSQCKTFFKERVARGVSTDDDALMEQEPSWIISDLKRSANSHCQFCALLLANMFPHAVEELEASNATMASVITHLRHGTCILASEYPIELQTRAEEAEYPEETEDVEEEDFEGAEDLERVEIHEGLAWAIELATPKCAGVGIQIQVVSDDKAITSLPDISALAGDMTSEKTIEKIKTWLNICTAHPVCSKWHALNKFSRVLPTRLLDLDIHSPAPKVRLVSHDTLPPPETMYATLSHCWGGVVACRLLHDNIEVFHQQITMGSIPKTFRDAILTTRRLGISYLWIDALCIIQDSEDDWSEQAALMGQVYANSYLNISATASKDGQGGLFRSRDIEKLRPILVQPDQAGPHYLCHSESWFSNIETSPVSYRAWILQERWLAPRVVHFGLDQVHWECASIMTSETLPDNFMAYRPHMGPFKALSFDISAVLEGEEDPENVLALWDSLVQKYTRCELTFFSDKPIAISGLARVFCNYLDLSSDNYLYGLWKPHFIEGLLWRVCRESKALEMPSVRTWSWSWLSLDEAVFSYHRSQQKDNLVNVSKVIDAMTVPKADPFGAISSATVRVCGPLCEARLTTYSDPLRQHSDSGTGPDAVVQFGDHTLKEYASFALSLDDPSTVLATVLPSEPIYLLLCRGARTLDGDIENKDDHGKRRKRRKRHTKELPFFAAGDYECLILVSTGIAKGQFRRIGVLIFCFDDYRSGTFAPAEINETTRQSCLAADTAFRSNDVPDDLYESVDEDFMYTITLV